MVSFRRMSDESSSTERNNNIWAPWRSEYIEQLSAEEEGCFLCRYRDAPESDEANLVLWRGKYAFVIMNRFPYTGGHLLMSPYEHVATLAEMSREALVEIMDLVQDAERIITHAIHAQGFNVGFNVGRCSGAGIPGHVHLHMVPRWEGDTNFMSVLGSSRVVSQSLQSLYERFRAAAEELNLPRGT